MALHLTRGKVSLSLSQILRIWGSLKSQVDEHLGREGSELDYVDVDFIILLAGHN